MFTQTDRQHCHVFDRVRGRNKPVLRGFRTLDTA
jgi:hypothetical protein